MSEKRNLKQEALDYIHSMLLCQQLKWGDRVSEETIAKQIGISRTPVREALNLYCEMGVFKRLPRFGTMVRIPKAREIEELFDIRIALESYAVSEAIRYITSEELAQLENTCKRLKALSDDLRSSKAKYLEKTHVNELYVADHEFHLIIIRATGNRTLFKYMNDNRMLTRILGSFRIARFGESNVTHIYNEHYAIFKAIQNKNEEEAVRLLSEHIRESKRGMVTDIKKELDQMEEHDMLQPTSSFIEFP